MKKLYLVPLLVLFLHSASAVDSIQFRTVDLKNAIVELHNFGASPTSLSGWRFCTHDQNLTRQYSSTSGALSSVTLGPGESLFIHWNNDAPAEANHLNRSAASSQSDLVVGGSFATPLDATAFALGIYISSSFGSGAAIADHLQWSIGGVDNTPADERSDEAQDGGVWQSQTDWISTTAESDLIELTDTSGARLHSSANYVVSEISDFLDLPKKVVITGFNYDRNGNIMVDVEDLSEFGVDMYLLQISSNLADWTDAGISLTNSFALGGFTNFPIFFRAGAVGP